MDSSRGARREQFRLAPSILIRGGLTVAIIGALIGAALGSSGYSAGVAMTTSLSSESAARFCVQCGQALIDGILFCGARGARKGRS